MAGQHCQSDVEADAPLEVKKWKRPRFMFAILSFLYLWVFADRGIMASNAVNGTEADHSTGLRDDIDMSNTENGLLSSLLTAGLLVGAPLTAKASLSFQPMWVIGSGMIVWCLPAFASGFSMNYYFFAVCRFLMGLVQYPVFSLGSILVDELAPEGSAALWFSLYYLAGPVGVAVGFVFSVAVTQYFSWRFAFWFEAAVALPVVLLCFGPDWSSDCKSIERPEGRYTANETAKGSFWKDLKTLLSHSVFTVTILGDILYMAFMACLSYWGARQAKAMFDREGMDIIIGVLLVISAAVGSVIGGTGLDRIGSTIPNALSVAAAGCFISAAIVAPNTMFNGNFFLYTGLWFTAMIFFFLPQGPLGGATLWSIPTELRRLGRDVRIEAQIVLGTIPAPALYGVMLDVLERDSSEADAFRLAGVASVIPLFAASSLFFVAAFLGRRRCDYRESP